jgi:hypothetical protein
MPIPADTAEADTTPWLPSWDASALRKSRIDVSLGMRFGIVLWERLNIEPVRGVSTNIANLL